MYVCSIYHTILIVLCVLSVVLDVGVAREEKHNAQGYSEPREQISETETRSVDHHHAEREQTPVCVRV